MKILILGNGFDLAHNLPTTYNDFLSFLTFWKGGFDDFDNPNYTKFCNIRDEIQGKKKGLDLKISQLAVKNIWVLYFILIKGSIKENWLDFETEIFNVIKLFENNPGDMLNKEIKLQKIAQCVDNYNYKNVSNKLVEDLYELILLLEIYLKEVVSQFDKQQISFFNENNFDKVLSFNYTNTYRELYNDKVEIDFIHGEADYKEKNNMVIGVEETLSNVDESENVLFIETKKYFQRIEKQTGSIYKKWLSYIKRGVESNSEIHIFGHSLDTADGDIIRDLFDEEIINKGTVIHIYYHNDSSRKQLITNLVKVLSKDRVIDLTSAVDERIKFIPIR